MSVLILVFALALSSTAFAANPTKKQCTKQEAIQAENGLDSLKNWDDVYRSYRTFSHCDDGSIAEGYSDVVTRLLADDWKHFPRLVALANANKPFREFVLKHIDETVSDTVRSKISDNARSRCPRGGQALCDSIAGVASK
jgi:hypothetical protein